MRRRISFLQIKVGSGIAKRISRGPKLKRFVVGTNLVIKISNGHGVRQQIQDIQKWHRSWRRSQQSVYSRTSTLSRLQWSVYSRIALLRDKKRTLHCKITPRDWTAYRFHYVRG